MSSDQKRNAGGSESLIDQALREKARRDQDYRERALKLFPWVCARCGREFSGKKLKELTVHHKDHNHNNNPRDGSNWELLCLYCHDNEHQRGETAEFYGTEQPRQEEKGGSTINTPFAGLEALLKGKK